MIPAALLNTTIPFVCTFIARLPQCVLFFTIRPPSNSMRQTRSQLTGYDQTYKIAALNAAEIWEQEPELLKEANRLLGRIWVDKADVLVVDKLGKNISGDGMDPNVSGTFGSPGRPRNGEPGPILAQRTVVLDLTDESHGNFNGIGVADVTTKRLIDKSIVDVTYPNALTSTLVNMVKMPIFAHSDENAIKLAVRVCNMIDKSIPASCGSPTPWN